MHIAFLGRPIHEKTQSNVFFMDLLRQSWISRETLLKKIAEADFYVAPRFQEAMAMGKITLASDDATMNEYIDDGQTSYLFDKEGWFRYSITSPVTLQLVLETSVKNLYNGWRADKEKLLQVSKGHSCAYSLLP